MAKKALYDRIVVKEIIPTEVLKTASGIELDKTAIAQAHTKAEIRFAGADVKAVKVGDIVLFTSGAGNPILIDGEELILLRAEQLDFVF